VLLMRTFVSDFRSSRALVVVFTRRRVCVSAALTVAVSMRSPVRPTYGWQQALLSRSGVVFALRVQGPHAVEDFGAEVNSGATWTADGSPAAVALDVVVAVRGVGEVVECVVRRVAGAHWFGTRWAGRIRSPRPAVPTGY
jgi:hypothetical protein